MRACGLFLLLLVGCANNMVLDDVATDATPGKDATTGDAGKADAKADGASDAIADVASDAPDDSSSADVVVDGSNCVDDTRSPTTAMDVGTIGTRAWSNPTNVYSADNQNAQISAMINQEISHYLQIGGFGFNVPNNMKIVGVTLDIQRKSLSAVGLIDHRVRLVKGGNIGMTDKSTNQTWSTNLAVYTYGGMNDLWGDTFTPADVNAASFGAVLAVRYNNQAGNDWPYVDHMQITVRYCP